MMYLLNLKEEEKIRENFLKCEYLKKVLLSNNLELEKVVIGSEVKFEDHSPTFELPFKLYLNYKGRLCKYNGLLQETLDIDENNIDSFKNVLNQLSFKRDYNSAFTSPLISTVEWNNIDNDLVTAENYKFLIAYIENNLNNFFKPFELDRENFFEKEYKYKKEYENKNLTELTLIRLYEKLKNQEINEELIINSFNAQQEYELREFKNTLSEDDFNKIKDILNFKKKLISENIKKYILG